MDTEQLEAVWKAYAEKNAFKLNPDERHVDFIVKGVIENERKFGLRLCPCRLRDGSFGRDLELICPCNFEVQEAWQQKGMCWCGLFVRR